MSAVRRAQLSLPPLGRGCRFTVVIPARNEAARIGATLDALAAQRELDGAASASTSFDVFVYANNCDDGTAEAVRRAAARHPALAVFVVEESLSRSIAHIGTARKTAMDAAYHRYLAADVPDGVLATTDADTLPAPTWVAWTRRELHSADAVTGRIHVDAREWTALPAAVRAMLREEDRYHLTVARLASVLSPRVHDPWPHHWQRSGPSIAVRLSAYERAGGVPPLRTNEDVGLYDALLASGARIRHSMHVRVTTSARFDARAAGGFGARIKAWYEQSAAYRPLLVEEPEVTLARLAGEPLALGRPCVPAAQATAVLRHLIAREISELRATRRSVSSMAG